MIFKLFIAVSGIFGLFRLFKIENKFAWIITAFLALGVLLIFIPNNFLRVVGYGFLNLPVFLIIPYALFRKDLFLSKRINLLVQAVPMGISQLLFVVNMSSTNLIGYAMIVPIGAFIYTLTALKNYKDEIGFLLIISSYSISRLAIVIQHGF